MTELCVIIPAVKKSVAFTDDLVKKLGGISLIQRAIDKAEALVPGQHVYVVTDSQEIRVIAERNSVRCFYRSDLRLEWHDILRGLRLFLGHVAKQYRAVLILHPYTPLISSEEVARAYHTFQSRGCDVLVSVKEERHRAFRGANASLQRIFLGDEKQRVFTEIRAFQFLRSRGLRDGSALGKLKLHPHFVGHDTVEIESYQDWWVCEKLLGRRRIVFRVIGDQVVGMGHIYRALALAHDITDHEIYFVCDEDSQVAASKLAGYNYPVEVFPRGRIEQCIIKMKPDLVVNDILNTTKSYVQRLKEAHIRVVNFEDLGTGARHADITFNEIYEEPLIRGANIKWGCRYYFLRDEFDDATPHRFAGKVRAVLLTFGGTDQNDFTRKTLSAIGGLCQEAGIKIYVVSGDGYVYRGELERQLASFGWTHVEFTHATGVMSSIMEKSQVAISSNGRTVYELAYMNIPAIIISHHAREKTHHFARSENGFVNLGIYSPGRTEKRVRRELERLVNDSNLRRTLFERVRKFSFRGNKQRVVKMILRTLGQGTG